jgi:hypothetical protein
MPTKSKPKLRVGLLGLPAEDRETLDTPDSGAADCRTPPFDFTHTQKVLRATHKTACC